ncbi:MAG: toxin-antitoxin system YwqK family antitoxin [Victivallales bacterium]|nr:toxin-antitoxin system YwqK family antitoxin [Victivallales bacterium]
MTSAAVLSAYFMLATPAGAQNVSLVGGVEYKNVSNLRDLDDFYSFDHGGNSHILPKHRIKQITAPDGKVIYEFQDLRAVREGGDPRSLNYVFLRNDRQVAKGSWINMGHFRITSGRPPDGIYREFYDSGELWRTFQFESGVLNGICKVFFRSGRVEREGTFRNGREVGRSKMYYPDGSLRGWSDYENGLRNGPTELYHSGELIKAKLFFKDGMPVGEQVMYYENGNLESKITYDKNGVKSGPVQFFYESGKLKQEGTFVNGNLHGTVTTFFESGRVKQRREFVDGRVVRQ